MNIERMLKYTISSLSSSVIIPQFLLWILSKAKISGFSSSFILTFGVYIIVVILLNIFDKNLQNIYMEDDNTKSIKGSAVFYLKNYCIPDMIISIISTVAFIILGIIMKTSPILILILMGLPAAMLFGVLSIFFARILTAALSFALWRLFDVYKPGQIILGIFNGVLISVLAIPLGYALSFIIALFFTFAILFGLTLTPAYEDLAYDILHYSSFFVALPLSWGIVYRINNHLRYEFLMETEGLIPTKEGIFYHIKNNKRSQISCMLTVFIILAILTFTKIPFALSGIIILTHPLVSVLVCALIMIPCDIFAVYYAQKHWRAKYFLDIFGYESRKVV